MIFVVLLSFTLYLVLNPIVYNGLRHFLYVVVFLTLIAGFLIIDIYGKIDKKYKLPAKALLVSYFIFTFARMVILHPYEYVYYNELIGGLKGAEGKFELDYWGAAYTEAAKYVGKKSQESNLKDLKIAACDNHLAVDYYSQFRYTRIYTSKNAHMNLCDTFKARYRDAAGEVSYTLTHPIVKTISREGVSLLNIYALPEYHEYFTK